MDASDLLRGLRASGFAVTLTDAGIRVSPSSGLTAEHRHAIQVSRPELVDLLDAEAREVAGSRGDDPPPATDAEGAAGPYSLSLAEGHRAHASPWGDAAIARFQARTRRFVRLGFSAGDADDLAERFALRDADPSDDRRACLECRALSGYGSSLRCGRAVPAGLYGRGELGPDLATQLQRCPAFAALAAHGEPCP